MLSVHFYHTAVMKVFLFLILATCVEGLEEKFEFLIDFFSDRNVMLTVHTCTKQDVIKSFLADESHLSNIIGLQINRNSSTHQKNMFNNFSPRNWYINDIQSCGTFSELLFYMNETSLFRYPLKHLFLINISNYGKFLKTICKYRILAASEVVVAVFNGTNYIEIFETYKIGTISQCMSVHYGTWSKKEGVTYINLNMPISQRRRNFQNHEIVVCAVVNSNKSINLILDELAIQAIQDEPYFFEDFPNVYNMLTYLNASFRIRPYEVYGHYNHTSGKFYGMINDLLHGVGDISGVALFVSTERLMAAEFIWKSNTWGTKFILKKPSMSYVENIYLMTFTGGVWIASLLILIIFGVVLYLLLNWEVHQVDDNSKRGKSKYTVMDATLLSLEALCQQGTLLDSGTYTGRILLFILFTAFMFLYVAYSGYILVLLQSTKPIASIQHLVNSRLECGGINISFLLDWYHVNKDPALMELYNKKMRSNIHMDFENSLARLREGNFALHTPLNIIYNYILKNFTNYDICKLQELFGYMNTGQYFVVPKTSQYKEFFKVGLIRVAEGGLTNRNKHRISRKPTCYQEAGNFQSIGIYDCYSIFQLFIIGSLLSVLVFIIEIAVDIKKKKKKSRNC